MNFIYVIHLLYWNQLTDLIIHSRSNRNNTCNRINSIHCNNRGARARAKRARPFIVSVPAVVSVAYVVSVASAVYDQVSQLVPVQQVDDIDEVHQLDPVHQVDHKDECSKNDIGGFWVEIGRFRVDIGRFWVDISRLSVDIGRFFRRSWSFSVVIACFASKPNRFKF